MTGILILGNYKKFTRITKSTGHVFVVTPVKFSSSTIRLFKLPVSVAMQLSEERCHGFVGFEKFLVPLLGGESAD